MVDPCRACSPLVKIVDLRPYHDLSLVRDGPRWELGKRPRGSVRGLCMHQWGHPAPGLSSRARARVARGESTSYEEYAERCRRTVYHVNFGVDDERIPFVALVHPVEMYMHAANGANRTTVSVSCMGAFPRFERDRDPVRHGAAPGDAMRIAGQSAICQAILMLRKHGHRGPIGLSGHGQWTAKPADPGEWLWRQVVDPASARGAIEIDPAFRYGDGSPVPW